MSDRTLAAHSEKLPNNGSYVARIERSAAGAPGLLFIIDEFDEFDDKVNEMCVVLDNGADFLEPVVEWLISRGF